MTSDKMHLLFARRESSPCQHWTSDKRPSRASESQEPYVSETARPEVRSSNSVKQYITYAVNELLAHWFSEHLTVNANCQVEARFEVKILHSVW